MSRNEWIDIAMRRRRRAKMAKASGWAVLSFFIVMAVGVITVVGLNHLVIDHADAIAAQQQQLFSNFGPVR